LAMGDDEMFIQQGALKALEFFKQEIQGADAGSAGGQASKA
jgi:hypothetical protein